MRVVAEMDGRNWVSFSNNARESEVFPVPEGAEKTKNKPALFALCMD
jgi:hypothetical protein